MEAAGGTTPGKRRTPWLLGVINKIREYQVRPKKWGRQTDRILCF